MPTVSRLSITPVKSTRLHHPTSILLEPHGAVGDRGFFFVREDGGLLTGSKCGPLVQIVADHDPDAERLTLAFPDGTVVQGSALAGPVAIQTNFFGRTVPSHLLEGPWAEALSRHAERPVRLARCDPPAVGTDVHPVTLVSTASVEELRRRGGRAEPLDAGRFRMLIEVDGSSPHEEDGWSERRVRVGGTVVRVRGPVPRCVVTTLDPVTGTKDFETLEQIAAYRGVAEDRKINFGMYGDVETPGVVQVGDAVEPMP